MTSLNNRINTNINTQKKKKLVQQYSIFFYLFLYSNFNLNIKKRKTEKQKKLITQEQFKFGANIHSTLTFLNLRFSICWKNMTRKNFFSCDLVSRKISWKVYI